MIQVIPYDAGRESEWNEFVAQSKNGAFLFDRSYMEYHSDRFVDDSQMLYSDSELIAILPANRDGDDTVSHGGLTFGGLITNANMSTALMLDTFAALLDHLRNRHVRRLVYKPSPACYHCLPADEDLYALFRNGGKLIRRDVGFILRPSSDVRFRKGNRYNIRTLRTKVAFVDTSAAQ